MAQNMYPEKAGWMDEAERKRGKTSGPVVSLFPGGNNLVPGRGFTRHSQDLWACLVDIPDPTALGF